MQTTPGTGNQADYVAHDKIEKTWPYAPEQDSFYRIHASIKTDMDYMMRAIAALSWRAECGHAVQDWERSNLKMYWRRLVRTLRAHHDLEEGFLIPWLHTRTDVPQKVTKENRYLQSQLSNLNLLMEYLQNAETEGEANAALLALKVTVKSFQTALLEHFAGEEAVLVPLKRKNWTHEEATKVCSQTFNRALSAEDMAQILRPMNMLDRLMYLKQERVGAAKSLYVLHHACKKYDRTYTKSIQEVIRGTRMTHNCGLTSLLFSFLRQYMLSSCFSPSPPQPMGAPDVVMTRVSGVLPPPLPTNLATDSPVGLLFTPEQGGSAGRHSELNPCSSRTSFESLSVSESRSDQGLLARKRVSPSGLNAVISPSAVRHSGAIRSH